VQVRGGISARIEARAAGGSRGIQEGRQLDSSLIGRAGRAEFMEQLHLYVDVKLKERGALYEMAAHIF
jgi:hypothetical protein